MDVSATGAAAAAASAQDAATGGVDVVVHDPSAPVSSSQSTEAPAQHTGIGVNNHSAIAPAVAKLFNVASPRSPVSLNVSYRVINDTHQIITVFTDPKTGQEVASFPPEVLVNLAQFFDQQHGATFDRNA
jgi:uncharacterized FlaG/YvyC family protein